MSKKHVLCDEHGFPILVSSALKHQRIPDREALVNELSAIVERSESGDLAAMIVRARASERRERVVQRLESAFTEIVSVMIDEMGFSEDVHRANFKGTGRRAAEAFYDMHPPRDLLEQEIHYQLLNRFPATEEGRDYQFDSMVVSLDNVAFGICPHHLLPIMYVIHLAYIPDEDDPQSEVLGLSKLSRLATAIASQPLLHELVAQQIADYLHRTYDSGVGIRTSGSAVVVSGRHMCLCARGAHQTNATTVVQAVRGAFINDHRVMDEFLAIVEREARLNRMN